jgi:6,7-dimethyl-8-ribityllumazine synthase
MLRKLTNKRPASRGGSFAIVASRYNARYVDSMIRAAVAEFNRAGARVRVHRVPGAYEIPLAAAQLARRRALPDRPIAAIVCLGVLLRGETVHAAHIGEAVSQALMRIQLDSGIPVVHEVLLLENPEQARARCLDKRHNRGFEAARTALEMAQLMRHIAES